MDTAAYVEALGQIANLPDLVKEKFISLAEGLTPKQREKVVEEFKKAEEKDMQILQEGVDKLSDIERGMKKEARDMQEEAEQGDEALPDFA